MGNYVSDKKNFRFFGLKLHRATDKDLIEHLEKQPNKQEYLKRLIRESMKEEKTMTAQEIIEKGYYDSAVALMDDEIREAVHEDLAPCTDLEFLEEYMKRHEEKYGIAFVI